MKTYNFNINGHLVNAAYSKEFIHQMELLIQNWIQSSKNNDQRIIIFLAAVPGAGKSTLACLIEHLSNYEIQALGMDGFHHYQSYILNHCVNVDGMDVPMVSVKGCPESFDFERFLSFIKEVKNHNIWWPLYNRVKHDVEDNKIYVNKKIVIIEGNYLLLDEKPWNQLKSYCDISIYVDIKEDDVKERLILRKMKGGCRPHEAISFYKNSDGRNVRRVIDHRLDSDYVIIYDGVNYVL